MSERVKKAAVEAELSGGVMVRLREEMGLTFPLSGLQLSWVLA